MIWHDSDWVRIELDLIKCNSSSEFLLIFSFREYGHSVQGCRNQEGRMALGLLNFALMSLSNTIGI